MKNIYRLTLAVIMLGILTGCSVYSPSMLRAGYNNLSLEIAGYIKSTADYSDSQETAIDSYAAELLTWHRREKLPDYANRFLEFATIMERGEAAPFEKVKSFSAELSAFPHFHQAGDITLKLASICTTLTAKQMKQIRLFTDEENADYRDELMEQSFKEETDDIVDGVQELAGIMGVRLKKTQLVDIRSAVATRHDIREPELRAETAWNETLMAILEQRGEDSFEEKFTTHWNNSHQLLTGLPYELKQQNALLMASVLQDVLVSLDESQKQGLIERLNSLGKELHAMSNASAG